ncbi:hypothetical protein [Facklamia hominis]|uniref:hypothetical protein n=1 Tax=Facklamia hominis TaxID=178214 RepID=UPI000C7B9BC4|nr:hypothetical protein [Facklamia hominis]PKY93161.1 hypothetical protein CYJ56_04455 [Facklamia hominis]
MSVTRAMLKEAGVTENAKIDEIMDAYSRAIGSAKAQGESDLKSENESLRNQLQNDRFIRLRSVGYWELYDGYERVVIGILIPIQ